MTILHHEGLQAAMQNEQLEDRLIVMPLLDRTQIGPASIDVRLGTEFIELRRLERGLLDPFDENEDEWAREERVIVPLGSELVLHPGQFVLGATLEFICMPRHLAGEVLTRSSWARVGLIVATAVYVQPGFSGVLTLELANMGSVPMKLRPGLRIGQLVVSTVPTPTEYPYSTTTPKYVAPLRPQSSRLGSEIAELRRLTKIGDMLKGSNLQSAAEPPDLTST